MRRPVIVIAEAGRVVPVAGFPVAEMAAQVTAVPMAEIVAGPMLVMKVVVAEMMETMSKKVMADRPVGKAWTETVTAESPGHGVSLRQRDREENGSSHRNGFSQTHQSLTAGRHYLPLRR